MTTLDDDTRAEIEAAEAAAQASVVNVPKGKRPKALDDALARRVEVNVAQHVIGQPVARVGGSDPQVRELEAPYSRRVIRGTQTPTGEPAGKAKSATKKATASRRAKTTRGTS